MLIKRALSLAVVAILSMNMAMAQTNHSVGGPNNGWNLVTDYQTWAASQTFLVGDNLIFQYAPSHDVTEVSQADYASCSASNPLQPPFTGGETVIPLTAAGSRYFICATPGHCDRGMKVQVDISAASSPPPLPATPPSTSVPSAQPPRSSSAPPPKSWAPSPPPTKKPAPTPTPSSAPPPKKSYNAPPPSKTPTPISPSASTPAASSRPAPPPSAAMKVNVGAGLTVGFLLFMITLLNV